MDDGRYFTPALRRIFRTGVLALAWLAASASLAHAHGGMAGPDEMGPPLLTAGALGFVCYWLVILWPARRRKKDDQTPAKQSTPVGYSTRMHRRSTAESLRAKAMTRVSKAGRADRRRGHLRVSSGRNASDV